MCGMSSSITDGGTLAAKMSYGIARHPDGDLADRFDISLTGGRKRPESIHMPTLQRFDGIRNM